MCRPGTNFARLGDPLQGLHMGNAPLLSPAATSPPEGEILAALCFEMLMNAEAESRVNFPLRGHCYLGKRKKSLKIYLLVSI